MINDQLKALILENFPHTPTSEQEKVVEMLTSFMLQHQFEQMFMLRGYAGTGKTSLVGALVRTLRQLRQRTILLAPTGRAAKVMSAYADYPAATIHRQIYRQRTFGEERFTASPNLYPHTTFIVDEASMIANTGLSGAVFGEGRLLDDLIHYVYSAPGCRLILIGDTAQLPPVGEELSPALDADELSAYGISVVSAELTQVVRQIGESGILGNATMIRHIITSGEWASGMLPKIDLHYPDISIVVGSELIESLEHSYSRSGRRNTIVITRSNKRANIYNQGIRNRILDYEEQLVCGDMIMVAKNKYHKCEESHPDPETGKLVTSSRTGLIANGEMAMVRRARRNRSLFGFNFADVSLQLLDHAQDSDTDAEQEIETTVLLDTLMSEAPALTSTQQQLLFQRVCEDYPELRTKKDLYKAVREDEHYNALQIKYAYAVTCHKAQGGQWDEVYIDQGYMTEEMLTEDYLRWLYTAITRATRHVYLVNWPESQVTP